MRQDQSLDRIKSSALFGYVQCDIKVPEHLREQFANFLPIFENTNAITKDIGSLKQEYAEKKSLMCQPRRMLLCSFELTNGTIITPLLLFYLERGLVSTKIHRFVEYTPGKSFNVFLHSAVKTRRQKDESPDSSAIPETISLLANSSYGYQIMDRSRHSITKYTNDEKTHTAINNKIFKKTRHVNEQF